MGYYLRTQVDKTETLTTAHGFVIEIFKKVKVK